jgi:ABC-type Fe3+-siderophore transport system permease subunit
MTRAQAILLGAAAFAGVAACVSPFLGPRIDFETEKFIFYELRLPRTLLGLGVGAALATAGVVLQAILRNPLATEYTLGVASGSASRSSSPSSWASSRPSSASRSSAWRGRSS